jgi:RNA polymerase sigma factor (sigma-70 family)
MSVEVTPGADAREDREREIARRNGFEAAFLKHYRPVLAYAMRRTDTAEQAEDVAADTFAIAWRRWDSTPIELLPWLYGVARRVLANAHRTQSRQVALATRVATRDQATSAPDLSDGVIEAVEIRRALRSLSPADREALMLTEWEGLSVRDAARLLGCSAGALHVRLHRARRRLAARLDQSGERF